MINENLRGTPFPEFSRRYNVPLLSAEGKKISLKANSEECQKLAQRFGLVSLEKFESEIFFTPPLRPNLYPITAHFKANVTYQCCVTLEPFKDHVEEHISFEASDAPCSKDMKPENDIILKEDEEIVEPLDSDGFLDLGEIMAQYLGLSLDLYPHKPDAKGSSFVPVDALEVKKSPTQRPFLKLASLQKK